MSRGPWINTWTGVKFYLADPRPSEISVLDVAHALARINRYTGHGQAYSVAQHCVLASRMAKRHYHDELLPARMLVHDVSEAYLNDISSPLKSLLPDYRRLEEKVELAVEDAFGVLFLGYSQVKEIDIRMLLTERPRQFLSTLEWDEDWSVKGGRDLKPFSIETVDDEYEWEPWPAHLAETLYLEAFYRALPWMDS